MDKNNLHCTFCDRYVSKNDSSYRENYFSFTNMAVSNNPEHIKDKILVQALKCPNCKEISIDCLGEGKQFKDRLVHFHPLSTSKKYPHYIPKSIREDYEEAYSILELSPKASATLSRRCLQGMIRDFWKVNKKTLFDELKEIEDKVEPSTIPVLNALRQMGNIGAHPEKDINLIIDVNPDEALKLIKFIELLMKNWYISKHEKEELLQEIVQINSEKQSLRKKQT